MGFDHSLQRITHERYLKLIKRFFVNQPRGAESLDVALGQVKLVLWSDSGFEKPIKLGL